MGSDTTPMANPEDSDLDESNAQTHDVFLRRYTLSYSASCPPFFRTWVSLYENIAPTSWLSHYTLIVGDYYFDLERQGSLPFASVAKFRTRKSSDKVEHLSDKDKWRHTDERLGTTAVSPNTIKTKLEAQDQLFREKNTGAQNCLLNGFREYSLLNSNCQHFILELTRRINVNFVSDALEEKIVRDSTRPRTLCGFFLFHFGFILSLLMCMPSGILSRTIIYLSAVEFHIGYAISIIQDTRASRQRLDRLENEYRYLQTRDYRDMTWMKPKQGRVLRNYNRYRFSWFYQYHLLTSLNGSFYGLFIGLYFVLHFDAWTTVKVVMAICFSYPIVIGVPAYYILAFLKSENEVTQLLEDDEQKRIDAACEFITTCNPCNYRDPDLWLSIFWAIVGHPKKGLEPLADCTSQEVYQQPFGREDLGRAFIMLEEERTGNIFTSWKYLVCLFLAQVGKSDLSYRQCRCEV